MPKISKKNKHRSLGSAENDTNKRQSFNEIYKNFDNYNDLEEFIKQKNFSILHSRETKCTLCDKRFNVDNHEMRVKFQRCNEENCNNNKNNKACFKTEICLRDEKTVTNKQMFCIMKTKNHGSEGSSSLNNTSDMLILEEQTNALAFINTQGTNFYPINRNASQTEQSYEEISSSLNNPNYFDLTPPPDTGLTNFSRSFREFNSKDSQAISDLSIQNNMVSEV
jgi:hypothetical protein